MARISGGKRERRSIRSTSSGWRSACAWVGAVCCSMQCAMLRSTPTLLAVSKRDYRKVGNPQLTFEYSSSSSFRISSTVTRMSRCGGVGKCDSFPWAFKKASKSSMSAKESHSLSAGEGGKVSIAVLSSRTTLFESPGFPNDRKYHILAQGEHDGLICKTCERSRYISVRRTACPATLACMLHLDRIYGQGRDAIWGKNTPGAGWHHRAFPQCTARAE